MTESSQTKGQLRVRTAFNPNAHSAVDHIKQATAELIDFIEAHKDLDPRLAAQAQTVYEDAAMWAVKLVTTPKTGQ